MSTYRRAQEERVCGVGRSFLQTCRKFVRERNVYLPIILENDALVLNGGICGLSSAPPSSYTRFSASCSSAFKWFPSESGVLTARAPNK